MKRAALLACVLAACAPRPTTTPAAPPPVAPAPLVLFDMETPWPAATPEEAGLDRAALGRLVDGCRATDSDALLVLAGDRVVVARAFGHPLGPIETKSVTKGFVGVAVGFLIDEGKIALDDPLTKWFPEWRGTPKAKILLRHVLTHTSGLSHEPMAGKLERQRDRVAYVRGLDLVTEPGTTFSYNNEATMLMSAIVASAAGETIDVYLKRKLFDPLGIDDVTWQHDGAGNVTTNGGITLSAVSLAKVGLAIRDRRVVPGAWIDLMRTPLKVAPYYGMMTWTLDDAAVTQTSAKRQRLADMGFSAHAKLAPLDGRRFRNVPDYWMEVGRILEADERAELARKIGDNRLPFEWTKPTPTGWYWNGWLGQNLVVIDHGGIVAVRLRRMPKDVDDETNFKIGMFDFLHLLRDAQKPKAQ